MRAISILTMIVFLHSCASNNIENETDHIANDDFKLPEKVSYKPTNDYYKLGLMNDDALANETAARLGEASRNALSSSNDLLAKAVGLCYIGKYDQAKKIFDSIYRSYFQNPSYWNQLGTCYYQQKKYSTANLYYLKALDYRKRYVPAINNIGVVYFAQGDEQKALAAFRKAIKTGKSARTPRFNLSQIYLKYGMASKAQYHLLQLHTMKPSDADVAAAVATSYLMQGSLNKSLQYYSKIESKYFKRASIALNYAVLMKLLGRSKKAKEIVNKIDKRTLLGIARYYKIVTEFIGT